MKSTKEKGLYDYVIVNDNLERAFQELAAVAVRAVMGETGPPGAAPGAPSTSAAPGSSGSGTAVVSAAAAAADTPPRGGMLVKTRSLPKRGEVEEPKVCARARGGATRCLLPGAQLGGAAAARRMTPPAPPPTPQIATPIAAAVPEEEVGAGEEEEEEGPSGGDPQLELLQGQVALITGAGSGIGAAVAVALASVGMRVVAVARSKDALERLQQTVVDEEGVPPEEFLPVVCDLTKASGWRMGRSGGRAGAPAADRAPACAAHSCLTPHAGAQEAEVTVLPRIVSKRWPGCGVDVLINCAAVQHRGPWGSLLSGTTAKWVEMVGANMVGAAIVTREAVQVRVRACGVCAHGRAHELPAAANSQRQPRARSDPQTCALTHPRPLPARTWSAEAAGAPCCSCAATPSTPPPSAAFTQPPRQACGRWRWGCAPRRAPRACRCAWAASPPQPWQRRARTASRCRACCSRRMWCRCVCMCACVRARHGARGLCASAAWAHDRAAAPGPPPTANPAPAPPPQPPPTPLQAVLWSLTAPEGVDVADIYVRSLPHKT